MILILTTEAGDHSHARIIEWLIHFKANFTIMTGEGILSGRETLSIIKGDIFYNGINLSNEVTCVFYRRWLTVSTLKIDEDEILNKSLNRNLIAELYEIRNYLYSNLRHAVWIPKAENINVNKLSVLQEAARVGLIVPEYIVTNDKFELQSFYKKSNLGLITKAIGNFQTCYDSNFTHIIPVFTKVLNQEIIDKLPNRFCPSFFQVHIPKKIEYRVLFFDDKCYSTAILSQEQELTIVDSRINTADTESRLVPVSINEETEDKIRRLMNKLNLATGSIDIIHGKNNQYYFLEINPVGQIGGYSDRCLVNFEKIIVQKLISLDARK